MSRTINLRKTSKSKEFLEARGEYLKIQNISNMIYGCLDFYEKTTQEIANSASNLFHNFEEFFDEDTFENKKAKQISIGFKKTKKKIDRLKQREGLGSQLKKQERLLKKHKNDPNKQKLIQERVKVYDEINNGLLQDLYDFLDRKDDFVCKSFVNVFDHHVKSFDEIAKNIKQIELKKNPNSIISPILPVFFEKELITFEDILDNHFATEFFKTFLEQEFSAELIDFYLSVQEFKSIENFDESKEKIKEIYEEYVEENGYSHIEFADEIKQKIMESMKSPNITIFDEAMEEILQQMKTVYFPKFLSSSLFQKFRMNAFPKEVILNEVSKMEINISNENIQNENIENENENENENDEDDTSFIDFEKENFLWNSFDDEISELSLDEDFETKAKNYEKTILDQKKQEKNQSFSENSLIEFENISNLARNNRNKWKKTFENIEKSKQNSELYQFPHNKFKKEEQFDNEIFVDQERKKRMKMREKNWGLISRGGYIQIDDDIKSNLLFFASSVGDYQFLNLNLPENSAHLVNWPNPNNKGKTAIYAAIALDASDIANLLIKAGASLDVRDYDLRTPLHEAVVEKAFKCVKLLKNFGASLDVFDKDNLTPLDLAFSDFQNYKEIISILIGV
ncbi:regulator of g protein signaling [Anaeramoeba ignava]|uniref:Regulator of g protein signaling n=1 Tax=Anaeramoeba ignava TaxID=1746090 RepID=A0A9Q0L7A0_ANAIG|nr:regulator of g protein signaling [Anaeramoeba ignava]